MLLLIHVILRRLALPGHAVDDGLLLVLKAIDRGGALRAHDVVAVIAGRAGKVAAHVEAATAVGIFEGCGEVVEDVVSLRRIGADLAARRAVDSRQREFSRPAPAPAPAAADEPPGRRLRLWCRPLRGSRSSLFVRRQKVCFATQRRVEGGHSAAAGSSRIRWWRNSTGAPSDSRQRKPAAGEQPVPPDTSWPFTQRRTSPSIARM
jgi:hypothetical protein